jgi:hypothetical protein
MPRHTEPALDRDHDSDHADRDETWIERLDRNWAELLQELRVVQTGVQLLTGFLLTLPFQQRFADLTSDQRAIYLADVSAAVCSTALLIAPVALHRMLFRQHARAEHVSVAHRLAMAGSALLGWAICGVVVLIFDVVSGPPAAIGGGIGVGLLLLSAWLVLPLTARHRVGAEDRRQVLSPD